MFEEGLRVKHKQWQRPDNDSLMQIDLSLVIRELRTHTAQKMTLWCPHVVYYKIKCDFYDEKPPSRDTSFIGFTAMR